MNEQVFFPARIGDFHLEFKSLKDWHEVLTTQSDVVLGVYYLMNVVIGYINQDHRR